MGDCKIQKAKKKNAQYYTKITVTSKRKIYLYLANYVIISLYMAKINLSKGAMKLNKVEQIQMEIDNKNAAIEQEAANGQQTNHEQIIQWRNEISVLQMQLSDAKAEEAQQQVQEEQQQAQVAQTDGLKEIIRSIRDAVYLKELMDRALGITENATATQDFNSMVDQAVDEDQTALYAAFNTQLEQRDERFRLLTLQALEVQKQLDASVIDNQHIIVLNRQLTESNLSLSQDVDAFEKVLNDYDEKLRQCEEEIQRLKDREFELQQQIANVQTKPQIIDITPTAPSESLADKIAQAKVASIKQFSNLYSDVTYTDGTKEVVHNSQIPALPIPELPTAIAVDNQNVEQSAHPEQVNQPSEVQAIDSGAATETTGNGAVHELVQQAVEETTVTRAEHDALVARVERIEIQANIKAVA